MMKMITADPKLPPTQALCWSIYASNSLDLVSGISPHMLVFGREPTHPVLEEAKPGNNLEGIQVSEALASQLKAMIKARHIYASLQADQELKNALIQRIYSHPEKVKPGNWIYYKTNVDRYWKGPVKVTSNDGKRLYVLQGGKLLTVNLDDCLLIKEDIDEEGEEYILIPKQNTIDEDGNDSQDEVASAAAVQFKS